MAIRIRRGAPAGKRRKIRGEHGGRPMIRYPSRLGRRPFGSALLPNTDQSKSEVYYPVTTTTTAPPSPWVSYIGTGPPAFPVGQNSHWRAVSLSEMSWDGAAWVNEGFPEIRPLNPPVWSDGFRPTKIRVTYTATGTFTLNLYEIGTYGSSPIASQAGYVSGQEIAITFNGPASPAQDLGALRFSGAAGDLIVTDIEFLP